MGRIYLCDDICSPDCHNEFCIRCIKENCDYLIELCDDAALSAEFDLFFDDLESELDDFYPSNYF